MWVFSVVNLCFFVTKHIKHLNRISHSIESLDRKLIKAVKVKFETRNKVKIVKNHFGI